MKPPIKIKKMQKGRDMNERNFKKFEGIENNFNDPVVELKKGQDIKLDEFLKYCGKLNTCIYCKKKIDKKYIYSNTDDEIIIPCQDCLLNSIDSSKESKEYVRWFNSILEEYDMNFQNGFPKLLRHKHMGRCTQCKKAHDKELVGYYDFR